MSSSLSSLLHLHGLPPLPRSLTGYVPPQQQSSPQNYPHPHHFMTKAGHPVAGIVHSHHGRPSPPIPPPRPHSRRSSSSGSSFRASPEHVSTRGIVGATEGMRSSPRSLSSSPHSPHIDSGLGRSSADSFSEPRAFVRVVKSPPVVTRLDAQLSQLKKDMHHLRQQDMALLGHLLQIHQGIQDLKNVLVPPPQPAPTVPLPMFHSTPSGYGHGLGLYGNQPLSRHPRKIHHPSAISRGTKLFNRRVSAEKLISETEMVLGACGGIPPGDDDEESDSLSSLEFGDV